MNNTEKAKQQDIDDKRATRTRAYRRTPRYKTDSKTRWKLRLKDEPGTSFFGNPQHKTPEWYLGRDYKQVKPGKKSPIKKKY